MVTKMDDTIVYKEYRGAQPEQQQTATEMDAETSHRWNEWCTEIARREVDGLEDAVFEALTKFNDELHGRFDRRKAHFTQLIDDLRAEVAALRFEIKELQEHKNGYCG
jgi:hypothetical protein